MLKRIYAEIAKVEPQEDGTLKVFGYASSPTEDSEGEVITADAMKAALPDYMKFGAVREMHQPIAAGTAIEASVESDGRTFFGAHVVDPVAIKKVQTQTYKGFSIGGKVTKRDETDKKKITGLKLVEVSLVDRPANPDAVFTMYKAEADETPAEETPQVDDKKLAIDELAAILNKGDLGPREIVTLATAELARKAAPPVEVKKIVPTEMKKGMSQLSQFCSLLQAITWLTMDTAAEAEWEADNSPLPAGLRDWLSQGVRLFNEMAVEESAELIAVLQPMVDKAAAAKAQVEKDAAAKADAPATTDESLEKKGQKFSASTKRTLETVHKSMQQCCDMMDGLGYKQADDVDASADVTDVQKTQTPPEPLAEKIEAGDGDLLKAELAKSHQLIDDLQKRIKALEDQPLPPKGVLKAVTKGDDVESNMPVAEVTPIKKHDGQIDEAATLIKSAHQSGGFRLFART